MPFRFKLIFLSNSCPCWFFLKLLFLVLSDFSDRTISDPFLGDGLDPPDLSIVWPPPGSGTLDSPQFPPALLRANRLWWVSFIQPRMIGEMGLLHRPMSTWIFSACTSPPHCGVWDLWLRLRALHTSTQLTFYTFLYLTSCNLFLYRRPFGTPAL